VSGAFPDGNEKILTNSRNAENEELHIKEKD